ncbi:MAG: metallophosphoesterase [Chitinophagaceae bacterium]
MLTEPKSGKAARIQYCSDLHLEFPENKKFLKQFPIEPIGEILLLAGDIVPFAIMDKHKDFFDYISDHFETTYWIPGNHEYYYFDAAKKCGTFNEKIRSNIFLVNNTAVQCGNTNLIFSTLWSKINPAHGWLIEKSMSDFQVIKYNGYRFFSDQFNKLHDDSMLFLQQQLQRVTAGNTIVVTHHVPTFLHYPPQYKGDLLNEAFAVELFDTIETSVIDYWIYGHHHCNTPGFKIGNTTLLTNQLGYVQKNEHQLFKPNAIIEI